MRWAWRDRRLPFNVRLAFEAGRTHDGRFFAYVNVRNRNYWLRRYS